MIALISEVKPTSHASLHSSVFLLDPILLVAFSYSGVRPCISDIFAVLAPFVGIPSRSSREPLARGLNSRQFSLSKPYALWKGVVSDVIGAIWVIAFVTWVVMFGM